MERIYTLEVPDQPNKACMEMNSFASVLAISWQDIAKCVPDQPSKMKQ